MVALTLVIFLTCYHQSVRYWIQPHTAALEYMVDEMREKITDKTQSIHVIRQGRHDGYVKEILVECFGSPATEREWMLTEYTSNALREAGFDESRFKLSDSLQDHPDADLTIDMRNVAKLRK